MAQSETEDEPNECAVITDVALEQAENMCDPEQLERQMGELVGHVPADGELDCEAVMKRGLDEDVLTSVKKTREWVRCRAWTLVDEGEESVRSAINRAWVEARAKGEELDVEV